MGHMVDQLVEKGSQEITLMDQWNHPLVMYSMSIKELDLTHNEPCINMIERIRICSTPEQIVDLEF